MDSLKSLFLQTTSAATEPQTKALTALAALVQEREALAKKRTIGSVSWLPDVVRIRGSIVPDILGPVLSVTLFAIFVAAATKILNFPLRLSNNVVPLLSVVVGLLLVFRNGSAYERYSEGRKDFTTLVSAARNLSRLVWIQVSLPSEALMNGKDLKGSDGKKGKHLGPRERMTKEVLQAEKVRFLKLVNAFVLSVKHHLRGEPGTDYEDYQGVLPSDFQRYETIAAASLQVAHSSSTQSLAADPSPKDQAPTPSTVESQVPSPPRRHFFSSRAHQPVVGGTPRSASETAVVDERTPFLPRKPSRDWIDARYRPYEAPSGGVSLPLPLVVGHALSRGLFRFRSEGTLETVGPAGVNAMQGLVQTMIDQMGAMERVVRTPLPPVFQVHLKQCVTLYLFSLPLVLVDDMGWLMVFVVSLVAFTLMGIEGIAAQVENPFGTDDNDLPLDLEVAELRVEIEYIFSRLPEGMDDEDVFAL